MDKLICSVYKSLKKEGMYLYVEKGKGLSQVPEQLKTLFGQEKHAMTLVLTEDKALAKFQGRQVMKAISEQGYFLQLPDKEVSEMQDIANKNSLLSKL